MITSLRSPQVGRVRELLETHSPKRRFELGEYVIEGLRSVESALSSDEISVLELFATSDLIDRFKERDATLVSEEVMKKMSGTVTPQGVIAVVALVRAELTSIIEKKRIIFLNSINDPGNLGTVIRNAHAFGFDAIVLSPESVDPYCGKVVRASVGSIAVPSILVGHPFEELKGILGATHKFLALDMSGIDLSSSSLKTAEKLVLVCGSEAHGLPPQIAMDEAVEKIAIAMPGGAESLNVATAAAIAMYEISRD